MLGLPELLKASRVWLILVLLLKYDNRLCRVLTDILYDSMLVVVVGQAFLNLIRRYVCPAYASHIISVIAALHEVPLLWRGRVRTYELSQRYLRQNLGAHGVLKHIL